MSKIDMESILKKCKGYVEKNNIGQKVLKQTRPDFQKYAVSQGDKAGRAFIQSMNTSVNTNDLLGETAKSALSRLSYTVDTSTLSSGGYITVLINFDNDLHRESLAPEKYPRGVDNIAALLNSGYGAGHTVRGVWEGHGDNPIYSRTHFGGAHFIEDAINDFRSTIGNDVKIIQINVDDVYK